MTAPVRRPPPAAQSPGAPILRRRLAVVAGADRRCGSTGIEARLVYLQMFEHADLVARAERQHEAHPVGAGQARRHPRSARPRARHQRRRRHDLRRAERDRRRRRTPSRSCATRSATARRRIARRWSSASARGGRSPTCRRQVAPDQAQRVAALNLDGIGFTAESKRFYPNKELGAHLLGWVGIDNKGLSGLEYAYDPQIRGKAGTILIHTDARRHAFSRFERPPTSGSSVELTIDQYLQHIAERELHAGVVENRAAGGSAIVMNPHTGEILAMANEPTFNPNAYRDADDAERRNRAVQDLYEPGSTFKVVTASAAMEEKVLPVDALIDTSAAGGSRSARASCTTRHDYGVLSFTDVIVKSSNVGAIKIGFKRRHRPAERLRRSGSASAVRSRRTFPARTAASCGIASEVDRQRARVGVDGLSGRRDAAADGGGGELGRQRRRVRRAARRRAPSTATTADSPCSRRSSGARSAPTPPRR